MLQLKIERTTTSKTSVVECFAHKIKALVILLQETHCTFVDELVFPNFALAESFPSKNHGLATFVQKSLSWTPADHSPEDSEIECLCMDIAGLKIINIYKPPSSLLLTMSLLVFPSPHVYAGDFNSQHVQQEYRANTSNR